MTRFLVQLKEFGPKSKMTYQLEIEVVTEDDLEVMHANVARSFGVEINKENMHTLFMRHKRLAAHLNHTMIKKNDDNWNG